MTPTTDNPLVAVCWRRDGTPRPPRPLAAAVAAIFAALHSRVPRETIRDQLLAGETVETPACEWRLAGG